MNGKVEKFTEHYTETIQSCERIIFFTRSIDHQKKSIKELSDLLERAAKVRAEVIKDGDEEAANQILALRCMINASRYELKMWVDLKEEDWDKAWNALVDAQSSARSARVAHPIAFQCNVREYLAKLETIEKILFPPQSFNSPGIFVERFLCSICNEDYSDCEHIAGEPYWGFFCQKIVDNILGTREVALVENPKDKKARITEHITEDGMIRDHFTWEKREMNEEEEERYEEGPDDHLVFRGIIMTADDNGIDFSQYFPE